MDGRNNNQGSGNNEFLIKMFDETKSMLDVVEQLKAALGKLSSSFFYTEWSKRLTALRDQLDKFNLGKNKILSTDGDKFVGTADDFQKLKATFNDVICEAFQFIDYDLDSYKSKLLTTIAGEYKRVKAENLKLTQELARLKFDSNTGPSFKEELEAEKVEHSLTKSDKRFVEGKNDILEKNIVNLQTFKDNTLTTLGTIKALISVLPGTLEQGLIGLQVECKSPNVPVNSVRDIIQSTLTQNKDKIKNSLKKLQKVDPNLTSLNYSDSEDESDNEIAKAKSFKQ